MMELNVFLMKPKQQCHLSQWVKEVYGPRSRNEGRLLCESIFVLIDRQTLILKYGWNKSFLNETKASMTFILMREMSLWCPIMKEKRDYYVNLCFP